MPATRTTNFLLFVIALSLVIIAGKQLLSAGVSEAVAAQPSSDQVVRIYGCHPQMGGGCNFVAVRVDANGVVQVRQR
jgi:hypothetical protein